MQKKICMLGSFAVGKTSLTEQFVKSIFSERYHTTVGVRIHKKMFDVDGQDLDLIVWDLAGEDEFVALRTAYLRGASGYILVADGTRPETLDKTIDLQQRAHGALGNVPFVLMVNKADRSTDWAIQENVLDDLAQTGWLVFRTSAKTGQGVEDGFTSLARAILCGYEAGMASRDR